MNSIFKWAALILLGFVSLYMAYMALLPSLTIKNNSSFDATDVRVTLPSSKIDFGLIKSHDENTIYYSLNQPKDGSFNYQIVFENGNTFRGSCGYVTHNNIRDRLTISLEENKVVCE